MFRATLYIDVSLSSLMTYNPTAMVTENVVANRKNEYVKCLFAWTNLVT